MIVHPHPLEHTVISDRVNEVHKVLVVYSCDNYGFEEKCTQP